MTEKAFSMTVETFFSVGVDIVPTLKRRDYKDPPMVCFPEDNEVYVAMGDNGHTKISDGGGASGTVTARVELGYVCLYEEDTCVHREGGEAGWRQGNLDFGRADIHSHRDSADGGL